LLILMMMAAVCVLIPMSKAADTVVLSIDPPAQAVGAGEIFNVSIMIDIPPSLPAVGFEAIVTWNPAVLTGINMTEVLLHSVTPASEWGNINIVRLQVNSTGGYAFYACSFIDNLEAMDGGYAPITGNHQLATITLQGKSAGQSPFHFQFIIVGDVLSNSLPTSSTDGEVIVGAPAPTITVLSPLNGTYSKIPLNLTVAVRALGVGKSVSWVGYSVDDQANVMLATNVTFTSNLIQVSEGQHSLVVYANDSSGLMASSDKIYFTAIGTRPTADLAVSPSTSEAAAALIFGTYRWKFNFNASGSHAAISNISAYFWDFDDGTNATDAAVIHEYMQPGVYNVTLTVTDLAGNVASEVKTITINSASKPLELSYGLVTMIAIPLIWIPALGFYWIRTRRKRKRA